MNGVLRASGRAVARLGREESGVALMMTLSVILVLYVMCAGVYAVGETVRQKVELQNACDSAAYSAALAQADGLSRMAMINRALSWTYVQLTNAQLDYITYRWMKKVRDHFVDDRSECKKWNDLTFGASLCGCDLFLYSKYRGEGKGWFCGVAGEGGGKIRMNGKIVEFSTLDQYVNEMSYVESYGEAIRNLRGAIESYNFLLHAVNAQMIDAVPAMANSMLIANLPRRNGKVDAAAAKDMLWYVQTYSPMDPYEAYEAGGDQDTSGSTFFRPLFNTETDERIFLSMADNATYDRLEPYFSNGDPQRQESGGLDQWFIRSNAEESAANGTSVDPSRDSYMAPGICRVYKNTNRSEFPIFRRCHHINGSASIATSLFGGTPLNIDVPPSCAHRRGLYPEQCATVSDSVALYADYDWCSFQMHWACWLRGVGKIRLPYHTQYGLAMPVCKSSHLCCISPFSHARNSYKPCFVNPVKYAMDEAEIAYKDKWIVHPTVDLPSLMQNPYGHARIYGDDKDLYDVETYTGVPAKPWILGPNFFGRQGAIVVGMARRQRNPWQWLLNFGMYRSSTREGRGIYSAFDPAEDGYTVAFSAGRAAFRHPANGAGPREYETRYDSVCHNEPGDSKFRLKNGASFVGCVCGSDANKSRLGRCWNLCTSDWDGTLLPLAYACADVRGGMYDGMSPGEVTWESIGDRERDNLANPFEMAGSLQWTRFQDPDGDMSADAGRQSGEFLWMGVPDGMSDAGGGTFPVFNLTEAIKRRVL